MKHEHVIIPGRGWTEADDIDGSNRKDHVHQIVDGKVWPQKVYNDWHGHRVARLVTGDTLQIMGVDRIG